MVSIVLYSNLAAVNRGYTNWTGRGGVISILRPCITDKGYSLFPLPWAEDSLITLGWRGGVRLQDASRVQRRIQKIMNGGGGAQRGGAP